MQVAIDVLLESENLADLCKHIVELPQTNFVFSGAHIYLPGTPHFNFDSGYGVGLPKNITDVIDRTAITQESQYLPEVDGHERGIVTLPFIRHNNVEAVAVLVLKPGAKRAYIEKDIAPALGKLAGFYLEAKFGLGH